MRNTGNNRKKRIEQDKEQPTNSGKLEHASRDITMHNKIEQPVHDTQTRYRALFENANDTIFLMEADRFIECNPKAFEMFGCTPEQIIGKTPYDSYSPEFQPDGRESKEKALEKIHLVMQGKPQFFEWRHFRYDGSAFDAEVSLNRLEISGKTLIQAIVRDISERKQLESKLKTSEEKYKTLVEHVNEIIFMHDPDFILTYISPQCEKITGYSAQELIGQQWTSFATDSPLNKQALGMLEEARETGKPPGPHQVEIRKKNGEVIVLEVNDRILRNEEGDITGVVGSARDITNQKLMEQALRESEHKFKSIFDNANDGILVADLETKKFFAANRMSCEMLGYSLEEIENIGVSDIHPEEALPYVIEQFEKQSKNEFNLARNIPVKRKDGSVFYADVNSSLITLAGKTCLMGIFRDITERKKAQDELKRSKEFITNIINTLDDPFFVKDQEHRWFMLNDAACKVMGRPGEELIGKSDYDLFAKEQADKFWERDSFVLESGQTDLSEEEITWHGELHTISTKKSLFIDSITGHKFITGTIRDITEQKAFEKELKQSEETTRAFLNATTDLGLLIDRDGLIIDLNDRMARNLGGTRSDMIGTIIYDYLPPALAEQRKMKGLEIASKREPDRFEDRREDRWFENSVYPILDSKGEAGRFAVFSRDITERKRAEEAIRESEEKFRSLAEQSPNMIFINKAGKVVYANKKCEEITGYERKELYSPDFDFLTLIAPESLDLVKENFRRHSKGLEIPPYEYALINKAGERIDAINSSKLIQYEGRTAILGVVTDITERKRMEEAYHGLVDNSLQGLAIVQDGRMVFLNKAFSSTTGYSKYELLAASPEQLQSMVHPEDRELIWARHRDRIAGKPVPARYEFRWIRKDGSTCWVEIYASRIEYQGRPAIQTAYIDTTERKQAEKALKESEEKYRSLIVNIPDVVWTTDQNGQTTFISSNIEKIYGYTPKEIYEEGERLWFGRIHPDDVERVNKAFEAVFEEEVQLDVEYRIRRKDGEWIWLHDRSIGAYEKNGIKYADGVFSDITERKQAEEAMKKSSIIIDSTTDAVITTDIAGNITFWNKGAEILYGYRKEEAIGKPVSILYKDEDLHVLEAMIADLMEGKDIPGLEATCIDKNRQDIEILLSLTSVRDEDGNITELVGITKDITERKKSEEEIERIFNMTGYLICIADLNGYFKRVNSSFEQLLGYSSEELLKKPFFDFIHPDDREKTRNVVKEELSSGSKVIGFENRYCCKDGSYKWLSWTSHPVVDEGVMYAIAYDVTDRKKTQQKLLDYQKQLKSLASELLFAEERERRRIATGVHDDIGQKLALAKLELQSIQAIASESNISESLGHACELIDKAMQDTRSLAFDLSNPVLYEVGFVAAVESLLTEQMIRKSGIKSEFKSKTRKLKLDQDMSVVLFQAVREILTNVVKHANAKKVKVCIDKLVHRVQVIVEDDGTGFELSGLKSPDKEKGGFGLFNVKERLEYIDGSFDIESRPGQGTRVTVAVPLESSVTAS
ncbi:MAG: PAS domain S-box protein [Planctomycetes bacterium]|nr:PAS domain S-box protein [Planctomycetota bacterium]MBL7143954.1 PAS domain S-box protein [Phycisphaerae bacterium]